MYQYKSLEDTIVAIATPAGQGGIGIVRISGADALIMADLIFKCKSGLRAVDAKSYTVHYGWVIGEANWGHTPISDEKIRGEIGVCPQFAIDEALLTVMRGPKSYTAEDVVEISCHGGPAVVRAVLDLILSKGVRLAEPGEFTKRAFLNGRIDLAQAEAVADIISAKTQTFARVSQNQLKGELSSVLDAVRIELMSLYVMVEALINFPEDDIDAQGRQQILDRIQAQKNQVEKLLNSANNGRILKEGIRIVLCGKPNVGKSSLLNALLKQDRAIVTNIAGTTRDVLEESAQIKGVPFQLVDTAGILEPRDLVEEEAIKRSHLFIDSADLVLLILDASSPLEEQDHLLLEKLKDRHVLIVLNKIDLEKPGAVPGFLKSIKVSAFDRSTIEQLEESILKEVWQGQDFDTHGILISNIRHINALTSARRCLIDALQLMGEGASWEFVSQDIKDAVNDLDSITGRNIDQDLLDRIFSEFCIGK